MATDFLTASQTFCERLRLSGSGPTAVTNQPAEYQIPINLLAKAHKEIVSSHLDWEFLWGEAYVNFDSGGNPHDPVLGSGIVVRHYDVDTFRRNSDGEYLDVIDWGVYRKARLSPSEQAATGEPEQVVIQPDNRLIALPFPDANGPYRVNFDFWRTVTSLAANDDVLDVPDDSIEVVYDRARMLWLDEEESPQYQQAKDDFMAGYGIMEQAYWPGQADNSLARGQDLVAVTE